MYRAEIKSYQDTVAYIGLASNTFKERYLNHTSSFRNKITKKVYGTFQAHFEIKLSKETLWNKMVYRQVYILNPHIINKKRCNLCNIEKTLILTSTHHHLLNQRSELKVHVGIEKISIIIDLAKCDHVFISNNLYIMFLYLIICILQLSAVFFKKENHCKEMFVIIFFRKYAICDEKILEF